jgi:hypothetical protein
MSVQWSRDFGLPDGRSCAVRDLIAGVELGRFQANFTAPVPDSFLLLSIHSCGPAGAWPVERVARE